MMSTPKDLIESKLSEMPSMMSGMSMKYVCLDTGLTFETYDESAMYSPYTGSVNIELAPESVEVPDEPDMDAEVATPMSDPYGGVEY